MTWPPGRHYAHVEFNSESAANAIMDAYLEKTPAPIFIRLGYVISSTLEVVLMVHGVGMHME